MTLYLKPSLVSHHSVTQLVSLRLGLKFSHLGIHTRGCFSPSLLPSCLNLHSKSLCNKFEYSIITCKVKHPFITLSKTEISTTRDGAQKCRNSKVAIFLPNSHFGTFVPVHRFQKFFWSNDFLLSVMKDLLHTFAQKVSRALSRAVYVLI